MKNGWYSLAFAIALLLLALILNSSAQTSPRAMSDTASTSMGSPVAIPVLDNDISIGSAAICNVQSPTDGGGTAVLQDNKTIIYTPAAGFCGPDSFIYSLSHLGFDESRASVLIFVNCPNSHTEARC